MLRAMGLRRRATPRMTGAVLLSAGTVAVVVSVAFARDARENGSTDAMAGCAHASPLRKVTRGGKSVFIARLKNYDILGIGGQPSRVVTAPLYPRYPAALLVGGIGLEARHKLTAPVTVTAVYCAGGRVRLFSFISRTGGPVIPRPASAALVQRTGYERATLTWPPPITGMPPDKPRWMLTLYFYKPGLAVLRFAEAGREIDHLTFKVCVAGGPHLACR